LPPWVEDLYNRRQFAGGLLVVADSATAPTGTVLRQQMAVVPPEDRWRASGYLPDLAGYVFADVPLFRPSYADWIEDPRGRGNHRRLRLRHLLPRPAQTRAARSPVFLTNKKKKKKKIREKKKKDSDKKKIKKK
jgi:hypothetical protein